MVPHYPRRTRTLACVPTQSAPLLRHSRTLHTHPFPADAQLFSRRKLSFSLLGQIFSQIEGKPERLDWAAYPKYNPPEKLTPFRLAPALYYANAIETGASAMEMSAIAGRNAALGILKDLGLDTSASAPLVSGPAHVEL